MPKLKLYIFDYEGPEPAKMLEEALGTIFPAGLPAGATVVTAEPVEEPTEIEPLDEPTAVEEPATCTAAEVPAQGPPAQGARPHTGVRRVPLAELERTVAAIESRNGNRRHACKELGITKTALYRRLELAKEAGLDVPPPIRGNPKHREGRDPAAPKIPAVIAPPRPRRGRPPSRAQEPGSIAKMVVDRGPVAAAVDAIASELIVMEPQTPAMLSKRTKFAPGIIAEALRDDRFRKTGGGYALAPLKR